MAARLVSLTNAASIKIDKPVIFIGRDSECDVVLSDSRRVSRKHCCLAHINNQLLVRDLGSMNGVWINGLRVKRTGTMRPGDELSIGDVRFRLTTDDGERDQLQEEDASSGQPDASMGSPLIVSDASGDAILAEPISASDSSQLIDLPAIPLSNDDDKVIPLGDDDNYNDDDSRILPLPG